MMASHDQQASIQRGFTMIELLVVLVILSLTSALVLPKFPAIYDRFKSKSEEDRFYQSLAALPLKAYTEQVAIELSSHNAQQLLVLSPDWQLDIEQPILYKTNGFCAGGELHLRMKSIERTILLVPPYCDPSL